MHVNNQPMIVLLVLFTEEEEEKKEGHIMEGVGGITANLFLLCTCFSSSLFLYISCCLVLASLQYSSLLYQEDIESEQLVH